MKGIWLIILTDNVFVFSPGVIITEIHKRGGLDDEAYQMVKFSLTSTIKGERNVNFLFAFPVVFSAGTCF